ncbi:ABC transporter ATP-binding protein [archaeon 13_1_20CM_2_54_9]|nr:MAG: ABC transporter ATP-binding protein [Crenarchaeota archaeon 13_1_40CM_3_53_5]OLE75078.1 MAG: ABC transporter ATP-binding protein [archaeon 13_1_20CM_2_54_9]
MLEIKNLTKIFSPRQGPAISSVSFEVKNGEIVGFVGLNGAGKTTTIRIAVGVSLPTAGTAIIDGHDITNEKPEASKSIGWVPEIPNYEPNAKAWTMMQYLAGFYGINRTEAKKQAKELLSSVGLSGFENRKLRTYSQGMKKRFSLAVSLISNPQNFLFDEVLNGLDPEGIHFFRELMLAQRKLGKAILLSSHILTEIENLADRVVFIHRGKLIKAATRDELASYAGHGGVLRIVLQNVTDDAVAYLKTLGGSIQVEGNSVILSNFQGDSSQVNAELVKRGFSVQEIKHEKSGLEEYFFELIHKTEAANR